MKGTEPMKVRIYDVPGISCGHCKQSIEASVGAVPGVDVVEVDIDAKTVRVEGDASDQAIHDAIDKAGYDVAGVRR